MTPLEASLVTGRSGWGMLIRRILGWRICIGTILTMLGR